MQTLFGVPVYLFHRAQRCLKYLDMNNAIDRINSHPARRLVPQRQPRVYVWHAPLFGPADIY